MNNIFLSDRMNILDDSDYESVKEGEIYRLYTSGEYLIHVKYNPYFYQLDTSNKDKNIKVLTPIEHSKELKKYSPSSIQSEIKIMSKSTAEKQTKLKYVLLLGSEGVAFPLWQIVNLDYEKNESGYLLTDKIMTDDNQNDIFPVYTYNQEDKFAFYENIFPFQKINQ